MIDSDLMEEVMSGEFSQESSNVVNAVDRFQRKPQRRKTRRGIPVGVFVRPPFSEFALGFHGNTSGILVPGIAVLPTPAEIEKIKAAREAKKIQERAASLEVTGGADV